MSLSPQESQLSQLKDDVSFEGLTEDLLTFLYKNQTVHIKAPSNSTEDFLKSEDVLKQLGDLGLLKHKDPDSAVKTPLMTSPNIMDFANTPDFFKKDFLNTNADSTVLVAPMRDHNLLTPLHEQITASNKPTVPVLVHSKGVIIGPLVNHDHSRSCVKCLSARIRNKTLNFEGLELMTSKDFAQCTALWPKYFWLQIKELVQNELSKMTEAFYFQRWIRGAFVLDFNTPDMHYEMVFPVADCPICSETFRRNQHQTFCIFS